MRHFLLLWSFGFGMIFFSGILTGQSLNSVGVSGSGMTTLNLFSDIGSVAVTIDVSGVDKILVVATLTSKTGSGASTGGYRIADALDTSTNSGEFQLTHSGKDGIGTIAHIFDVSALSGNRSYVLQHRTTAQTLNTYATITAISLYDGVNQLSADLQQLLSPLAVNTPGWSSVVSATNFTLAGTGGVYLAASIQNQKTSGGSVVVSADWVLQYKPSLETEWKDLNYPVFRAPLGEQIGMVSLVGSLPNNTPAGDYDFRVAQRSVTSDPVHKIETQSCNLVVLGLGYSNGFFPIVSGTRPSASTTSTTLVPVLETTLTPQTATDLFVHAQYSLSSNGTTDPCTHDIRLLKKGSELTKSIDYLKYIASNQHYCSGSASLLLKGLEEDSVYQIDFRHASQPGRNMTTSDAYVTMFGLTRSSLQFVAPLTVTATEGLLSASFNTLKEVFDNINLGLFRGDILIQVNDNTNETASCVLLASGTGSSNYSSVLIYPTAPDLSIKGNFATSLIHLNGASHLTIDGRVNQIGDASLSLINESDNASSRTIRFENSAQYNTLKYLHIKGSTPATTGGVVFFSNSSSGAGNSHNLIDHCVITHAGERTGNLIYSAGTAGRRNSANTVRNSHLVDFISPERFSYGINIVSNSEQWLIEGNHFYDTEIVSPTETRGYSCIRISTTDVNNYTLSGNYLGGTEPFCGGTRWTVKASTPHFMRVISLSTSNSGGTSVIRNNVIQGFEYTSTSGNPFDGIYIYEGSVLIENNKIGDSTGTGSIILQAPNPYLRAIISGGGVQSVDIVGAGTGFAIAPEIAFSSGGGSGAEATVTINGNGEITGVTVTNPGSGYTSEPQVRIQNVAQNHSTFHGIWLRGAGTKTLRNNIIGSVSTIGSGAYVFGFEGVYEGSGFAGSTEIMGNVFGSLGTVHNINAVSSGDLAATGQRVYGIYSQNEGNTLMQDNVVGNITNHYSGTNTSSVTIGIYANRGNNTIEGNLVTDLTTFAKNPNSASSASVFAIGINSSSSGKVQAIANNKISRISNQNPSARVEVYGIYFYSHLNDWNEISSNLIQNLEINSSDLSSSIIGVLLFGGKVNMFNNIVHLGENFANRCLIYGVYDRGAFQCDVNMYHNTLLIEGAVNGATSSSFSYFNNHVSNPNVNVSNNLFVNTRSGGTGGKHYAIRLGKTQNVTVDYNDYYAPAGVLGWLGSDRTTLVAWQTATGQDANSYSTDPDFAATGEGFERYEPTVVQSGIAGTGVLEDFAGRTRSTTLPKIGALEKYELVWTGAISTDFNTAGNWIPAEVPGPGGDIIFAATPLHHCVLDQHRVVGKVENVSDKNLVVNGYRLTLLRDVLFSGAGEIDATSAHSAVEFAGSKPQMLPANVFTDNKLDTLVVRNSKDVQLDGNFVAEGGLKILDGNLKIGDNRLVVNGTLDGVGLVGGVTSALILGGTVASPVQLPGMVLQTLIMDCPDGITLLGDLTIGDTLYLKQGVLAVNGHELMINGNHLLRDAGSMDAGFPESGITFGNSAPVVLPAGLFSSGIQHLSITTSGGLTATDDITVSSSLNLVAANPSATKGLLDMVAHVLEMTAGAVTTGVGDVTGRIVRNGILPEVTYTFGHAHTTIRFYNAGVADMPDKIKFIVRVGETHTVKNNTIQRFYEIIRDGGAAPTRFTLQLHYLDSELNGLDESNLVFWDHHVPYNGISPHEHGKTALNTVENWISLSGHGIQYLVKNEYAGEVVYVDDVTTPQNQTKIWLIAEKETSSNFVWLGAVSSDWDAIANWSGSVVPTGTSDIIIPPATPYRAIVPANATREVRSVIIQPGAVLESGGNSIFKVLGALEINSGNPSWENYGEFIPGTGTVVFDNAFAAKVGTTNFYNLTIPAGQRLSVLNNGVVRVSNVLDNQGVLDAYYDGPTTFVYHGGNQAVSVAENNAYYHLVLGGTGVKTMPAQAMDILGDFVVTDVASVTAAASITFNGNFRIGENSHFATGSFDHLFKCDFENDGVFTAADNQIITLAGSAHQSIAGDGSFVFKKLVVNNTNGVSCYTDVSVVVELALTAGVVATHNSTITITESGSITGGSVNSHVEGKLARLFGGVATLDFPVGKGGSYYPATVEFTSLTGNSNVTIESFGGGFPGTEPAGIGLVGSRYWSVTEDGGSAFVYNLTLDGTGLVFQDAPLVLKHDGVQTNFHAATGTGQGYAVSGLTSFSDFAFGESTCTPPVIIQHPSSATQQVCQYGLADELFVDATGDGLSFQWYENTTNSAVGGVPVGVDANTHTPSAHQLGTWYYYVVVTGDCGVVTSTVSGGVTVNPLPTFTYATTDITCFNAGDGKIDMTAAGSSGSGYEYRINNGSSWTPWQSGGLFQNLSPGTYTLEVKDGNGCVQTEGD